MKVDELVIIIAKQMMNKEDGDGSYDSVPSWQTAVWRNRARLAIAVIMKAGAISNA